MNIFVARQSVEYLSVSLNSKSNPVRVASFLAPLASLCVKSNVILGKSNAKAQSELEGAKANHFPSAWQVAN
jgi:hypothetical protein